MAERKYPIGIQTFERIIRGGYVYVDKTDLVWNLTRLSPFVFLSRPRRFGKSLLSSTLHSYFEGNKDLFEGLKIMRLEREWIHYPVVHLDLSEAKGQETKEALRNKLITLMKPYSSAYGIDTTNMTPGGVMSEIIHHAFQKTGQQVVVIVDEYDAPLLEVLQEEGLAVEMRNVMQEFYVPLKANERMVRFCFITGITKFSQLSIFSAINNLKDVSLRPDFSAICGITDSEVREVFEEDIRILGSRLGCSAEEAFCQLKDRYDGYHFAHTSEDIYNPFSLLNTFCDGELKNYWFASGTPTFLIRQMQRFRTDITQMDRLEVPESAFDKPTESMTNALPLLYQSGYLTIKGYDSESMMFTLSMPNREVRIGYAEGLLPLYVGLQAEGVQAGFALRFWRALKKHDLLLALREMQAYLEGIPYVEGFKRKLDDVANAEGFYEYTLYLIFSMLNVYVNTQLKCSRGRLDMVVRMDNTVYVFELKTQGTAKQALRQIRDKGYSLPFETDGRKIVCVGLLFDVQSRTLRDWAIDESDNTPM